ncbi:MAG: hypothetical protein AAF194_00490 [Pseudomonadota bacterium]
MASSVSLGRKILLGIAALFGALFTIIGVTWLVMPVIASGALGASLLSGTGLATQIGDSASFFLGAGLFMVYGVIKRSSSFLMAGALLIGMVAPGRLIAWQVHGADLTPEPIAIEVLVFLLVAAAANAVRER